MAKQKELLLASSYKKKKKKKIKSKIPEKKHHQHHWQGVIGRHQFVTRGNQNHFNEVELLVILIELKLTYDVLCAEFTTTHYIDTVKISF